MGIVRQADRLSGRKVGGLSGNLSAKPVEGGFGKHVVPPFKNGQTYFAGLFSEQDGMGPIGGIAFFGGQMGGDLDTQMVTPATALFGARNCQGTDYLAELKKYRGEPLSTQCLRDALEQVKAQLHPE